MLKITAVIVDDERPAREEMLSLLKEHVTITVVAICKNVEEAKKEINRFVPDVIFLDIAMPGKSGFDLLEELKAIPEVVFVTAYDKFAVKAFEQHALDYLLKPVTRERLSKTIERITLKLRSTKGIKNLFIRDGNQYKLIPINEVFLIESFGNYVKLYYQNKVALQSGSLSEVISLLSHGTFFKINRKQVINKTFIKRITILDTRKLKIEMVGITVFTSVRKAQELKNLVVKF